MRRDLYADVKRHTCAKSRLLVRDLLAHAHQPGDIFVDVRQFVCCSVCCSVLQRVAVCVAVPERNRASW